MRPELFALHADLEERHWWFVARREIVAALVNELLDGKPGRVVDVGCGTGALVRALSGHHSAIGFDASAQAINHAQRLSGDVGHFRLAARAEAMLPELADADIVLLMDVIEHIRDDFDALSSILSTMKPGAQLLLTVPANPELWSPHDVEFEHFRRYSLRRLKMVWEGLAVTPVLVAPFNQRLLPIISVTRTVRNLLPFLGGRSNTDLFLPPAPVNNLLRWLFASETGNLLSMLRTGTVTQKGEGASWLAILKRNSGTITPRTRPFTAEPDQHDPDPAGASAAAGTDGAR